MHVGADERDELPLPDREHGASFHYVVLVLPWEFGNEVVRSEILCGLYDGFQTYGFVSEGDVAVDGVGEEEHVLQHHCDVFAKEFLRIMAYAFVVDEDFAFLEFVEATE